jgi:GntR family transcriptional repressor for pyruvate dehydrogenase complex
VTTQDRHVPRNKLSDAVARELTSLISSGEHPVGSRLPPEKDLAERFGVGRSSMREAVRTLEAAGYLRSTHGIGVFVINDRPSTIGPLDLTLAGGYTVSDLCEVRVAIERKTAELAAKRLTDHHRELLHSVVTAASDPRISLQEFVQLDGRFHRGVAEASGNPLLLYMWDSIAAQFEEYSMKVVGMPGRLQRAHADHEGIASAIIGGEPARASELACEHVYAVQRELDQRQLDVRRPRPVV